MKSFIKVASLMLLMAVFAYSFTSCKKEEDAGLPPNIAFKTGANYISSDVTVSKDTTLLVGIIASKSEGNDILTKMTVTVSYDGNPDSTLLNQDVPATSADSLSQDIPIMARSKAGTEKYTFSVVSKDGIVNSKSLMLTVN